MKKTSWWPVGHIIVLGGLLMLLRLWQNLKGFDPVTGLALPTLAGTALAVAVVLVLILEYTAALQLPKARRGFDQQFKIPSAKELPGLTGGSMFLIAGGILFTLDGISPERNAAVLATGILAVCAGAGVLLLTKQLRSGGELTLAPLLPALFFCVFLVLAVYLPATDDPVLARYYVPVLASAMAAYAFSQLAGFLWKESRPRVFAPTANCAAIFCFAAVADGDSIGQTLLFSGCAVILTTFLALQRRGSESDT